MRKKFFIGLIMTSLLTIPSINIFANDESNVPIEVVNTAQVSVESFKDFINSQKSEFSSVLEDRRMCRFLFWENLGPRSQN